IENFAFYGCTGLTSVKVNWSTPLVISPTVFMDVTLSNIPLYVPAGSEEDYEAAGVWKNFIITTSLGTTDFEWNKSVKLYPNPAQNRIIIETQTLTHPFLEIYDINGRVLQKQDLAQSNTVNIENLPSGVYLFKIKSKEGSSTQRVLKN
ncbi:MAG TPA: T9SS type A sorting domain-containing protein, partial [Mariniflexile sp.]